MEINYKDIALKTIEKYPKSQGKRPFDNPYVWQDEVAKELGIVMSLRAGKYFYEIIYNDTNDGFYSYLIIHNKWDIGRVYKLFKDDLYHQDKDNLFIPNVFNNSITNVGNLYNSIRNHYRINFNNFIYLMGLKDKKNNVLSDFKIGKTHNLSQRLTHVYDYQNDYPFYKAIWIIPSGIERKIENFIHYSFKDIRLKDKRDFYYDENNSLFNDMNILIKSYLGNDFSNPIIEPVVEIILKKL